MFGDGTVGKTTATVGKTTGTVGKTTGTVGKTKGTVGKTHRPSLARRTIANKGNAAVAEVTCRSRGRKCLTVGFDVCFPH